jgi:hypothetical protein
MSFAEPARQPSMAGFCFPLIGLPTSRRVFEQSTYVFNPPSCGAWPKFDGLWEAAIFNSRPPSRASDRKERQDLPEPQEAQTWQLRNCSGLLLVFAGILCSHVASLGLRIQTASDTTNKDLREDVRIYLPLRSWRVRHFWRASAFFGQGPVM